MSSLVLLYNAKHICGIMYIINAHNTKSTGIFVVHKHDKNYKIKTVKKKTFVNEQSNLFLNIY